MNEFNVISNDGNNGSAMFIFIHTHTHTHTRNNGTMHTYVHFDIGCDPWSMCGISLTRA